MRRGTEISLVWRYRLPEKHEPHPHTENDPEQYADDCCRIVASVGHIPSAKREYPQYRVAGHEANNLGEDVCYEFKHGITLPSERVIQQHFVRWDPTFLDMPNLLLRRFSQLLRHEARAGVDDAALLFFGDFCEHRERQHGSGRCFADRVIADFVTQMCDALLQV